MLDQATLFSLHRQMIETIDAHAQRLLAVPGSRGLAVMHAPTARPGIRVEQTYQKWTLCTCISRVLVYTNGFPEPRT